jgi:hypothetical protein
MGVVRSRGEWARLFLDEGSRHRSTNGLSGGERYGSYARTVISRVTLAQGAAKSNVHLATYRRLRLRPKAQTRSVARISPARVCDAVDAASVPPSADWRTRSCFKTVQGNRTLARSG